MISVLQNLLWSIVENIPHALAENLYFAAGGCSVLQKSIKSTLLTAIVMLIFIYLFYQLRRGAGKIYSYNWTCVSPFFSFSFFFLQLLWSSTVRWLHFSDDLSFDHYGMLIISGNTFCLETCTIRC